MDSINERVAEVLEAAADSILVHGWGQGNYYNYDIETPRCAVGHIGFRKGVELDAVLSDAVYDRFATFIYDGDDLGSIEGWNDTHGRTEGEVRDAMLLCAKDLRNKAIV